MAVQPEIQAIFMKSTNIITWSATLKTKAVNNITSATNQVNVAISYQSIYYVTYGFEPIIKLFNQLSKMQNYLCLHVSSSLYFSIV